MTFIQEKFLIKVAVELGGICPGVRPRLVFWSKYTPVAKTGNVAFNTYLKLIGGRSISGNTINAHVWPSHVADISNRIQGALESRSVKRVAAIDGIESDVGNIVCSRQRDSVSPFASELSDCDIMCSIIDYQTTISHIWCIFDGRNLATYQQHSHPHWKYGCFRWGCWFQRHRTLSMTVKSYPNAWSSRKYHPYRRMG